MLGLASVLIVTVGTADHLADSRFGGGVAVGFGYAATVLLGLACRKAVTVLLMATFATFAAACVSALSISLDADPAAMVNRGIAVLFVWIIAALIYYGRRSKPVGKPTDDFSGPGLMNRDEIFQAVFNQTFQFVAALDAKGNIIEANETLRDYAGVTANEIRSIAFWMLPIFQNDSEAQSWLQHAIIRAASGDFVRDEFVVSGIGDRSTAIDLSLKPIRDDAGTVKQIVMEARDITESRLQQEMLVQAQKMEAVGALTAGVAHDFNNLLMVVVGNLELLEKRIGDNPRALDRLQRAIKAAFRGQTLTQQLLAFSRRQSLNPTVIDINTLVSGMTQMYETLGDDIKIEFDLYEGLPPCEVDPTLLEAALLNIAINSRDAMPEGGIIRFQTASIVLGKDYQWEITELPPGNYICLAVSDTGEGIPNEIVSQVFDPFFTTKTDGQGTGLGLSMVYGFVRQSGGDVKIYSETGQGTTIRIYLPTTDKPFPEASAGDDPNAASADTSGLAVLLVDDDREVRDVVQNALRQIGCRIAVAENGEEAIDLIRAGAEYDLVFTDMVMTGDAGGPEVAQAARAANPAIPVIFCSGYPQGALDNEEASIDGALFLSKPFRQEELIRTLERALSRSARVKEGTFPS